MRLLEAAYVRASRRDVALWQEKAAAPSRRTPLATAPRLVTLLHVAVGFGRACGPSARVLCVLLSFGCPPGRRSYCFCCATAAKLPRVHGKSRSVHSTAALRQERIHLVYESHWCCPRPGQASLAVRLLAMRAGMLLLLALRQAAAADRVRCAWRHNTLQMGQMHPPRDQCHRKRRRAPVIAARATMVRRGFWIS